MKRFNMLVTAFSIAVLCILITPSARASEWNHETLVTLNAPIEVPGVGQHILPAGTYIFKIFDLMSDRHIVQIFNKDKTHLVATILAIPNYRLQATEQTVITFRERPEGAPEALLRITHCCASSRRIASKSFRPALSSIAITSGDSSAASRRFATTGASSAPGRLRLAISVLPLG